MTDDGNQIFLSQGSKDFHTNVCHRKSEKNTMSRLKMRPSPRILYVISVISVMSVMTSTPLRIIVDCCRMLQIIAYFAGISSIVQVHYLTIRTVSVDSVDLEKGSL